MTNEVFIQLKIITGEWGSIQILPVPCSPTYIGCTVASLMVKEAIVTLGIKLCSSILFRIGLVTLRNLKLPRWDNLLIIRDRLTELIILGITL